MAEIKAYSVRVEFLRPGETSYARLAREMYKKGFKQLLKGPGGDWVRLPKGSFVISTTDPPDLVKHTVTNLAIGYDETALVKLNSVIRWAA
jgi:hypothetical protein